MRYLVIDKQIYDNIFIQGPLAGVSNTAFRLLVWRHSKPAFTFTEMISAQTIKHRFDFVKKRYLNIHPQEGPVCVQLSGNDPQYIGDAIQKVTDSGASLINLNCGCPVKKIRAKKAGSYLLSDSDTLYQLAVAMKKNTHLPVSLKIRIDSISCDSNNERILQIIKDTGIDFLIVHGRHWQEDYTVPPNYQQIKYFVDNLSIPVIGNGDVCDPTTLATMLTTQCAGVMIGRGSVGNPWLIKQLKFGMQSIYSKNDIKAALIDHVKGLLPLFDDERFALIQARSFLKYYLRNIANGMFFIPKLNNITALDDFIRVCESI